MPYPPDGMVVEASENEIVTLLREMLGKRRLKIARMRNELGMEVADIADELGISDEVVKKELQEIRKVGETFRRRLVRERLCRSRSFDDRQRGYAMPLK